LEPPDVLDGTRIRREACPSTTWPEQSSSISREDLCPPAHLLMLDAQRGRKVFKRNMALNQLKRTLVNDVDAMDVERRARNA